MRARHSGLMNAVGQFWRPRTLIVLGFLLACPPGLAASTYIFNESPALQCYLEADKRSPPYSVEDCDLALDHEPLSLKNRAATFSNRGIVHRKLQTTGKRR